MIQNIKNFPFLKTSLRISHYKVLGLIRNFFSAVASKHPSKMNYKKIAIGFFCLFMFGILVGFIGFPALLKKMIKGQIVLKPGGATRALWSKVPFPVDFLVYVFNVTNPEEVIDGGKPIVQEIGPFVFDEWKDKYDLEDNEEEDTVSFNMRNTFIFRPERSNGLTGEEMITIPHPLIMPLSILVARERRPMLNLIAEGIKIIFKDSTAMITAKFMDLFFRGIPVECTSEEFAAKAICLAFHTNQVKGGVPHNETHFKFSLFAAANHTDAGRFTVSRGVRNSKDVGRVLLFDDEPQLSIWGGDECNKYIGTDSTIFPPFMKKEDGIWAFAADLCRSLGAYYTKKSSYHGISTLRYTMDFGDIKNDEKLHCFCNNPPDDCPVAGTMDLQKCVGGPLVASLPHFYRGDSSLFENIIGLNPNEKDHAIFIDFELMTGSPLSAAKRLQFNLDVEPVPEVEAMKNVRKMIMPLFWVEEGASLNKTYTDMMKKTLFLGLKVNQGIRWFSVLVGLIGMGLCAFMMYKQNQEQLNATQSVTEKVGTPDVTDLESTKY